MIKWLYNDLKNGTPRFEYAKLVGKFRWILDEKYEFYKLRDFKKFKYHPFNHKFEFDQRKNK